MAHGSFRACEVVGMRRDSGEPLRRLIGAVRTSIRVTAVLCACAGSWRAPVPWLHCHVAPSNQQMASNLSRHLRGWHADSGHEETGWHLHFVLIDDLLRGGGCPVPPGQDEGDSQPFHLKDVVPTVDSPTNSHVLRVGRTVADSIVCTGPEVLTRPHGIESRCRSFDGRPKPQQLQKLLCVSLC